jgi:hypothetical protein
MQRRNSQRWLRQALPDLLPTGSFRGVGCLVGALVEGLFLLAFSGVPSFLLSFGRALLAGGIPSRTSNASRRRQRGQHD